jgi:hypothetical protein
MFIGHPEAGERSAVIYTLLGSCRRHGLTPSHSRRYDNALSKTPLWAVRKACRNSGFWPVNSSTALLTTLILPARVFCAQANDERNKECWILRLISDRLQAVHRTLARLQLVCQNVARNLGDFISGQARAAR